MWRVLLFHNAITLDFSLPSLWSSRRCAELTDRKRSTGRKDHEMSNNATELYWKGNRKVVINDLTLYGTDFIHDEPARHFMNFAFELFYDCRQNVMKCTDSKMRKEMTAELEDVATTGSGWGISDLKEAIEHAVEYKAENNFHDPFQWYSNDADTYECIEHDPKRFLNPYDRRVSTLWQDGTVKSATSCVVFVREMDKRFSELGTAAKPYNKSVDALKQLAENRNSPEQDWKDFGEMLKTAGSVASEAQKWMWLAPDSLQGYEKYIGNASSFLGVANKLKDIGNNYVHYGNNLEMAILEEALGFLPILGGFYAQALHMIPGIERWFKRVVEYKIEQIDSIFHDESASLSMPPSGVLASTFSLNSESVLGSSRQMGPQNNA